ncbi:hypothetical protein BDW60DRAFT_190853 [Aspergillus nidulans var. acristatus]
MRQKNSPPSPGPTTASHSRDYAFRLHRHGRRETALIEDETVLVGVCGFSDLVELYSQDTKYRLEIIRGADAASTEEETGAARCEEAL